MIHEGKHPDLQKKDIEDIFPLTAMQEDMLFIYKYHPGIFFEQFCYTIDGKLDADIFKKSWEVVIEVNEVLRTVFRWHKLDNPVQILLRKKEIPIEILDYTNFPVERQKELLQKVMSEDRQEIIKIDRQPVRLKLCCISDRNSCLIFSHHHILLDGWSNARILEEVLILYHSLLNQKITVTTANMKDFPIHAVLEENLSLGAKKGKYKEYIKWYQRQDSEKARRYWLNYLSGYEFGKGLFLHRQGATPASDSLLWGDRGHHVEQEQFDFVIGRRLTNDLTGFAARHKVTLSTLFQAAWGILLQRYVQSDDVLFHTIVAVRPAEIGHIDQMAGLFINTVPVRIRNKNREQTFSELVREVSDSLSKSEEYFFYSSADIRSKTFPMQMQRQYDPIRSLVVYENYPVEQRVFQFRKNHPSSIRIAQVEIYERTFYDFDIMVRENGELKVRIKYNKNRYTKTFVLQVEKNFRQVFQKMASHPTVRVDELLQLTGAHAAVNRSQSGTKAGTRGFLKKQAGKGQNIGNYSIVELWEQSVVKFPDIIAVKEGNNFLSYRELDGQANRLAYFLRRGNNGYPKKYQETTFKKTHTGSNNKERTAALLLKHGADIPVGVLGALKAGFIYVPLDAALPVERLKLILKLSRAEYLITHSERIELAQNLTPGKRDGSATEIAAPVNIDQIRKTGDFNPAAHVGYDFQPDSGQPACILYTSGTTGTPKGVVQTQKNITGLLEEYVRLLDIDKNDHTALFTSYTHVVSVIDIFSTFFCGGCLYPYDVKKKEGIENLPDWLRDNNITIFHSVPTVFRYVVADLGMEEILPSVRLVILGGETVKQDDFNSFKRHFARHSRFVNLFGCTEMLLVSAFLMDRDDEWDQPLIPVGVAFPGVEILILDENNEEKGIFGPGELVYRSPYLSPGYWQDEEQTGAVFMEDPANNSGKVYRSGDLGKRLIDNNLVYSGRKDQQVKIRGNRVELAEIEYYLERIPGIAGSVVTCLEDEKGEKCLAAYFIKDKDMDPGINDREIRQRLSGYLPEFMLPVYMVELDKLPLSAAGKIDRNKLPQPGYRPGEEAGFMEPVSETERKLAQIWRELFAREKIGICDSFFESGGHSLIAATLIARIHKIFAVELKMEDIVRNATLRELASLIERTVKSDFYAIRRLEKRDYYELSSAQKRIFILSSLENAGVNYNTPHAVKLMGNPDDTKFEDVLQHLIRRHESFRTFFILREGQPYQRICGDVSFHLRRLDIREQLKGKDETEVKRVTAGIIDDFIQPFTLSVPPLLRAILINIAADQYLFCFDVHHIISDGTSVMNLFTEFIRLYNGASLPELNIQYPDFTYWQNRQFAGHIIKKQADFWKHRFSTEIPVLDLPYDFPRPLYQSFSGESIFFNLDNILTGKISELGEKTGSTLFMILLAAYTILLSRYSGMEDIVVGVPIAGRNHADLENLIGMFVNTLAVRCYPCGDMTFTRYLAEIKKDMFQAYENQDYPLEELVEALDIRRDLSRNSLFDTMFTLQNMEAIKHGTGDIRIQPYEFENKIARFDISVFAGEQAGRLHFKLEYCKKLFKRSTIRIMIEHFMRILELISSDPAVKNSDIDILSPAEKCRLIATFNQTSHDFPAHTCIHQLFEEQVSTIPDKIAVALNNKVFTYRKIDELSNRAAHFLLNEAALNRNEPVGIYLGRSEQMVCAVLGILKAGGCYVPIDTKSPFKRLLEMIADSNLEVILSDPDHLHGAESLLWESESLAAVVCLGEAGVKSISNNVDEPIAVMRDVWDFVGAKTGDDITRGGWISSYTGLPFSREEISEYVENTYLKLQPYLKKNTRILEIGTGSGLILRKIAPCVGYYCATDFSAACLRQTQAEIDSEGIPGNIKFVSLAAHQLNILKESAFDIIIINSVIQYFPHYEYLRDVLKQAVEVLAEKGIIFLADIRNLELKGHYLRSLEYDDKKEHPVTPQKNNPDAELFVSPAFFRDWRISERNVAALHFSNKIFTIKNELTRYRYDLMVEIDKSNNSRRYAQPIPAGERIKRCYSGVNFHNYPIHSPALRLLSTNPAYVIYTSGSTGKAKGVVVEHRALVNFFYGVWSRISLAAYTSFLSLTYISFDIFSLELIMPLTRGKKTVIAGEKHQLDGKSLNELCLNRKVEVLQTTPSRLQILLDNMHFSPALKQLKLLLVGGEALPAPLPGKILSSGNFELYNMYGPTETTVWSTVARLLHNDVTIGAPIANTQIYILDRMNRLQPIGLTGELCIGGAGLAHGYLNNPELTAEKFSKEYRVRDAEPGIGDKEFKNVATGSGCFPFLQLSDDRLYRTGDLARWRFDGNLEFLGRIDHQLKIRGFRIEPGEIENRLLEIDYIKEAAVLGKRDERGEKYLCAYVVSEKKVDMSELRAGISKKLPAAMIPAFFVQVEQIPRTPNGKIDRKSLPEPREKKLAGVSVPENPQEEKLLKIWSHVLNLDQGSIGMEENFFELGGHSLKAVYLISQIQKEFDIEITLNDVFSFPTIRQLGKMAVQAAPSKYEAVKVVEKKEYYAVSSMQKSLYILQQMDPHITVYNVPGIVTLKERIDEKTFASFVTKLIDRHESLRTSFLFIKGAPVQRVITEPGVEKNIIPVGGIEHFIRPFNLETAPLFRAGLIEANKSSILVVDMHHIVSDEISINIIQQEFIRLFENKELPAVRIQYKDYSEWQNNRERKAFLEAQGEYWLKEFALKPHPVTLPLDFERPLKQSFSGDTIIFEIEAQTSESLRELADSSGSTLYMILLAILNIFLSKISGSEDIVVGTDVAGRRHADIGQVVGLFVNTLALRNYPAGGLTFSEFHKELKQKTLHAFENQDFPFVDLVNAAGNREINRNPFFDVMYSMHIQQDQTSGFLQAGEERFMFRNQTAKFDLMFSCIDNGNRLQFEIEYNTELFKSETVTQFIHYFREIAEAILRDSRIKLNDIVLSGDLREVQPVVAGDEGGDFSW